MNVFFLKRILCDCTPRQYDNTNLIMTSKHIFFINTDNLLGSFFQHSVAFSQPDFKLNLVASVQTHNKYFQKFSKSKYWIRSSSTQVMYVTTKFLLCNLISY